MEQAAPATGNFTERSRSLATVFGAALALGPTVRGELIVSTGLSKATVSRLVEELGRLGLLVATNAEPDAPPLAPADKSAASAVRGRRPTLLSVPPSAGQVIGVSLGLQQTGVLATDLAGRVLSWETLATPRWESASAASVWLAQHLLRARNATAAPLRRVVVAVPARVLDGAEISHPPLSMAVLAGFGFSRGLAALIDAEVELDTDANMALTGLTAEGIVPEAAIPVLLNLSTVLTMAMRRRDGSMARGLTSSFGNFSLLPVGQASTGTATIGELLSTHGLLQFCADRGLELESVDELWTRSDPRFAGILEAFTAALTCAVRMIAVIADPLLVVLAGRLVPLVEVVLPETLRRISLELEEPLEILAAAPTSRCRTTSHGAATLALARAQHTLCAHLAAGLPTAR